MADVPEVQAMIASLGETKEQIAKALQEAGASGVPEESDCCPVACYLNQRGVGGATVNYGNEDRVNVSWREGLGCEVESKPLASFLAAFDAREYPALIADN